MVKLLLATIVAAVLAVAMHQPVCAKTLVWRGGDMNFTNAKNWEGPLPLKNSDVSSVDLRSEQSYTSYIPAETYSVGSRMKLPMNGRFVFQGDDSVVIKFNEQATGDPARFKGPRNTIDFDFNCPNNWRLHRGSREFPTSQPPRSDDVVFFERGNAYHVFSDAPLTNVDKFIIGDIDALSTTTPGPATIERCSDLPADEFSGLDCTRFFIRDESACVDEMSFYDDASRQRECMYYNSCPTKQQEAEQRARQIEATQYAASEREKALSAVEMVGFSFDVPLALLAHTEDVEDVVHTALQDPNFIDRITTSILSDLNSTSFSWMVTSFAVSYDSDSTTLTLAGSVTGQRRYFLLAREDPHAFDSEAQLSLPSDPSQAGVFHTEARVLTRIHVPTQAGAYAGEQAQALLDDNCPSGNPGTCSQLADLAQAVDALETALEEADLDDGVPSSVDLAAVLATACADGVCPTDLTNVTAALMEALGGDNVTDLLPAGTLDSVAAALAGLNVTAEPGVPTFVASGEFGAIGSALNRAEMAAQVAQPATRAFTSAPIVFGQNLPALTLQLLVNTDYSDAFSADFTQSFLSATNADSVDSVALSLVDASSSSSSSSDSGSATRRRRASDEETVEMVLAQAVVTYTATCLEDECDMLMVTDSSPRYPVLRDAANAAAASLDPKPYQCFITSASGGVLLFDTLPEEQCLLDAARTLLAGNGGDPTAAFEALFGDTACGLAGTLDDGSCVLPISPDTRSEIETRVRNAVNAATTTTTTTSTAAPTKGPGVSTTSTAPPTQTISTDKSTGAASSVGAIAGGAAAGLIAIVAVIVVLVVLRRRGGPGDKGKASSADPNRHVVAFENPMYDDPGVTGSGPVQPVYEAAADGDQEEGLYDEPAFALNNKNNPIYESNEALDAGEEGDYDVMYGFDDEDDGEGGGYLDVAPDAE